MKSLGYHLILEFEGCDEATLDDREAISKVMVDSVRLSGATLIRSFFHKFAPQGVSGMVIISESHFSIHTWPEYGYAAVDIFTCGDQIDMDMAADAIRAGLEADAMQKMLLSRGMLDLPDAMIRHKPAPCLRLVPET
jgi:S-adenosylmethionine decarboxylase